MNDIELLTAAAKAAGMPHSIWWWVDGVLCKAGDTRTPWNPLTDDGAALRLAVKLGLDVCIDTPQEKKPFTNAIAFVNASADTVNAVEFHGDPYAATRRAIVRAAAEIGQTVGS